ncbi:DUF3108 domain-containing protein [Collimonas sp.]|jgi:hypothetical protein|uniref:DUF3108 domain-containing protein n=1 Tax=Collimonas sp. TaxID=1963772 RepID=UPI0037BFF118
MPSSSVTPSTADYRLTSRRRWLWVPALTVLLHVLLISWGSRQFGVSTPVNRPDQVILADLLPLPPVEKPVLLPQTAKPKQKISPPAHRKPTVASAPAPVKEVPEAMPEAIRDTPIRETVIPRVDDATMAAALAFAGAAPAADAISPVIEPAAAPAVATLDTQPTAGKQYHTNPPPSAELKYDVEALNKGQNYYGSGKITWQTDGGSYSMNLEAGVLFFTVLDVKSEGEINGFGVAPVTFTQKRFRKQPTITTFHRELNQIVFSDSSNNYPRSGGEQDRSSVVWQLASIGRGDSSQFAPGTVIDMFVAGPKDAETWRMQVVGEEQINVSGNNTDVWHVIRIPQAGSHEQRLDIWLAPQQEWYPVKLRFTESDGDYTDMSLSKLKRLDAAAAN